MQHPDEGTIHAWIDGELLPDDASALEAHLKECQECSALAAEARGLVAASSRIISALDLVPGGVIPKAATRRPWYASTQLRAAAAVVIVAGASLLVMRNGSEMKMERVMQASAPTETAATAPVTVAAQPELDQATPQRVRAPVVAKIPPKPAPMKELEGRVSGARVSDLRKESVNDAAKIVAQAPPPAAPAIAGAGVAADEISAAAPRAKLDSVFRDSVTQRRRFLPASTFDNVVVTGVATSTAPAALKKLRADSAKNETVYEVSPGVEVTLTDNGRPANVMLRASAQSKGRQMAAANAPAPPPPAVAQAAKATIDSITWTDKRGHVMVLRGAVSKEQLETIRQRLPEDQR
jgi:antitoxin (DNA-binding transcriptional repressor) of toxin-antitoxin stability system